MKYPNKCDFLILLLFIFIFAIQAPTEGYADVSNREYSISETHMFEFYPDLLLHDDAWRFVESSMEMNRKLIAKVPVSDLDEPAFFEALTHGLDYTLEYLGSLLDLNPDMNDKVLKETAQQFFTETKKQLSFSTLLLDKYDVLSGPAGVLFSAGAIGVHDLDLALLKQEYGDWIPNEDLDRLAKLLEEFPAIKALKYVDEGIGFIRYMATALQMQLLDIETLKQTINLLPGYPLKYGLQLLLEDIQKDPVQYVIDHYTQDTVISTIKSFIMSPLSKGYARASMLGKLIVDVTVALAYRGPSISDYMHFIYIMGFNQSIYNTLLTYREPGVSKENVGDFKQLLFMLEGGLKLVSQLAPDVLEAYEINQLTLHFTEGREWNAQDEAVIQRIRSGKLTGKSEDVLGLFGRILRQNLFSYEQYITECISMTNAKLNEGSLQARYKNDLSVESAVDLLGLTSKIDALYFHFLPGTCYGVTRQQSSNSTFEWISTAYHYLFDNNFQIDKSPLNSKYPYLYEGSTLELVDELTLTVSEVKNEDSKVAMAVLERLLNQVQEGDLLILQDPSNDLPFEQNIYPFLITEQISGSLNALHTIYPQLLGGRRYKDQNHVTQTSLNSEYLHALIYNLPSQFAEGSEYAASLALYRPPQEDTASQNIQNKSGQLRVFAGLNQTQFSEGDIIELFSMVRGGQPPYRFWVTIEQEANSGDQIMEDFMGFDTSTLELFNYNSDVINIDPRWWDGARYLTVSVQDALGREGWYTFQDVVMGDSCYVQSYRASRTTLTQGEESIITLDVIGPAAPKEYHFTVSSERELKKIVSLVPETSLTFDQPGKHYIWFAIKDENGKLTNASSYDSLEITVKPADLEPPEEITGFAGGNGSAEDPYRIETAEQLLYFSEKANGGKEYEGQERFNELRYTFKGKHVVLGSDITLNEPGNTTGKWHPISKFEGTFDGRGHTIYGFFLYEDENDQYWAKDTDVSYHYYAFINENHGILRNLTLEGVMMDVTFNGQSYFAPFVRNNERGAVVENCVSRMTAIIDIANSFTYNDIGGIVLRNGGTVSNCINQGSLINTPILHGLSDNYDYSFTIYRGIVRSALERNGSSDVGRIINCRDEYVVYGKALDVDFWSFETEKESLKENYVDATSFESITTQKALQMIAQSLDKIGMRYLYPLTADTSGSGAQNIEGEWDATGQSGGIEGGLLLDLRSDGTGSLTLVLGALLIPQDIIYRVSDGYLYLTTSEGYPLALRVTYGSSDDKEIPYAYLVKGDTLTVIDEVDGFEIVFERNGDN